MEFACQNYTVETFGNNGWKLEFLQTGTGTASSSTIGADTSGNDNHWTSNNLASTDIMLDHPENNFCTLNPVAYSTLGNLTQGNLTLGTTTNNRVRYVIGKHFLSHQVVNGITKFILILYKVEVPFTMDGARIQV